MPLNYEDVNKGDTLPEQVREPLEPIDLVRYSGASGDFNPIHTVPEVAQSVGLDGIIAHGMLLMSYAGQMITKWAGVDALRRFKVRFSGMTRPGEALICEGRVTGKEVVDGENLVHGRLTLKGKADGSTKIKGEFTVVLPNKE